MAKVILGLTTILARSGREAAVRIEQGGYDVLLLDFPATMQHTMDMIRSGAPAELGVEVVRGLFGALSESWLYKHRFILEALSRLPQGARMVCIGDEKEEKLLMDERVSISLLEYRSLAGHIDSDRWRRELRRLTMKEAEVADKYTQRVFRELDGAANCLLIFGSWAKKTGDELRRRGHLCETVVFGQPYLGTPLQVLMDEIARGDIPDERIRLLVGLHLDFLSRYVTASKNVDEAYDRWVSEGQWVKLLKASG